MAGEALVAARKRWSVTLWPGVTTRQYPSEKAAYKAVNLACELRQQGLTRTSTIVVKVSDAGATSWQTYERIVHNGREWLR